MVFSPEHNLKLQKLHLICNFTSNVIVSIAANLKNLKILRLDRMTLPFPRDLLRMIFKNLLNVEELNITTQETCDENPGNNVNVNIGSLQKLKILNLVGLVNCTEISLEHLATIACLDKIYCTKCEQVCLITFNIY